MIRTLLTAGYLICSLGAIQGQVSGYLGQRNTLAITVSTFPNSREMLRGDQGLHPNVRGELGWEHVVSRRMSLRAFVGTLQTRLFYERPAGEGSARIEAQSLGLEMRFFNLIRRGNIAPIGPYQSLSLNYLRYTSTDLDGRFEPGETALGRYGDWVLSFTLGTQRIVRKRVFFHVGLQGAWVMNLIPPDLPEWRTAIRNQSIGRLREHLALNIMGGIGLFIPQKPRN